MLSRIFFQISAVGKGICICAYMHASWAKLYTGKILFAADSRRSKFCLSTLEGNMELLQS